MYITCIRTIWNTRDDDARVDDAMDDADAADVVDDAARAEISRALDALLGGELRARAMARNPRAVEHFERVRAAAGGGRDGGGDAATRDGSENIAPRALLALFERPVTTDVASESDSESEVEEDADSDGTYETVAGVAYGTKIAICRFRGSIEEEKGNDVNENVDEEDDGAMDSDSDDAYGGYASSSSENIVKRMARLRARPMGTCEEIELADDDKPHTGNIRAFRVSPDGAWFLSAGDDKLVKLWSVDGWRCVRTISNTKKISSACFTPDSRHLLFADKFGEVFACEVGSDAEPTLMLGHCSTIITDIACMNGGKNGYVITGDREHKTRVSVLPKVEHRTAFNGSAPEIQSFCYGHEQYISCVQPLTQPEGKKKGWGAFKDCIITGSGDATVRMWDAVTGEETDANARIDLAYGEICDIATRSEGTHVAVAIEDKKMLAVVHLTSFKGVPKLFLVGYGPDWAECAQTIKFDRRMVLYGAGVRKNEDGSQTAVFMREGTVIDGLSVTLSAAESVGMTYFSQLRKREYSEAQRMERKANRKDMLIAATKKAQEEQRAKKRKPEDESLEKTEKEK